MEISLKVLFFLDTCFYSVIVRIMHEQWKHACVNLENGVYSSNSRLKPMAKAANFPCTKVDEGLFYVELFLFNKRQMHLLLAFFRCKFLCDYN